MNIPTIPVPTRRAGSFSYPTPTPEDCFVREGEADLTRRDSSAVAPEPDTQSLGLQVPERCFSGAHGCGTIPTGVRTWQPLLGTMVSKAYEQVITPHLQPSPHTQARDFYKSPSSQSSVAGIPGRLDSKHAATASPLHTALIGAFRTMCQACPSIASGAGTTRKDSAQTLSSCIHNSKRETYFILDDACRKTQDKESSRHEPAHGRNGNYKRSRDSFGRHVPRFESPRDLNDIDTDEGSRWCGECHGFS